MSRLTLTPHDKCRSTKCSLDCVSQNGTWLIPCTDDACNIPIGYLTGNKPRNYQLPSTIGFMHTKHGTYMFDTRDRFDGMPLFRGYTREQWGFRQD